MVSLLNGRVIKPRIAFPCGALLLRVIVFIMTGVFIVIVDAYDGACKGGHLAESHEDGLVDLTLRRKKDAHKEEGDAGKSENGGDDELYEAVFHRLNC